MAAQSWFKLLNTHEIVELDASTRLVHTERATWAVVTLWNSYATELQLGVDAQMLPFVDRIKLNELICGSIYVMQKKDRGEYKASALCGIVLGLARYVKERRTDGLYFLSFPEYSEIKRHSMLNWLLWRRLASEELITMRRLNQKTKWSYTLLSIPANPRRTQQDLSLPCCQAVEDVCWSISLIVNFSEKVPFMKFWLHLNKHYAIMYS